MSRVARIVHGVKGEGVGPVRERQGCRGDGKDVVVLNGGAGHGLATAVDEGHRCDHHSVVHSAMGIGQGKGNVRKALQDRTIGRRVAAEHRRHVIHYQGHCRGQCVVLLKGFVHRAGAVGSDGEGVASLGGGPDQGHLTGLAGCDDRIDRLGSHRGAVDGKGHLESIYNRPAAAISDGGGQGNALTGNQVVHQIPDDLGDRQIRSFAQGGEFPDWTGGFCARIVTGDDLPVVGDTAGEGFCIPGCFTQ